MVKIPDELLENEELWEDEEEPYVWSEQRVAEEECRLLWKPGQRLDFNKCLIGCLKPKTTEEILKSCCAARRLASELLWSSLLEQWRLAKVSL